MSTSERSVTRAKAVKDKGTPGLADMVRDGKDSVVHGVQDAEKLTGKGRAKIGRVLPVDSIGSLAATRQPTTHYYTLGKV